MSLPDTILQRRTLSTEKIVGTRSSIQTALAGVDGLEEVCIYVTGSLARGDASKHSDLDVFLFHVCESPSAPPVPRLTKIAMWSKLIEASRELGFPAFSQDGKFLEVHSLSDMKKALGSENDDAQNFFTARMLLLLESTHLFHPEVYDQLVESVVDTYFRDYERHPADFKPVFLLNDIVRFWKTLCLNYERRRNDAARRASDKPANDLKNLKLKFSRLLTCYSMVAMLIGKKSADKDFVIDAVKRQPLARIETLVDGDPARGELFAKIATSYAWFLDKTGTSEAEVLTWIKEKPARDEAFAKAEAFGTLMFEFIQTVAGPTNGLRFLVI